jgi:tRNA-binding protein
MVTSPDNDTFHYGQYYAFPGPDQGIRKRVVIGLTTEAGMAEITFDDFLKIEVRVGTVIAVEDFPEARRPAYKLRLDFGPEIGERKTSAQLTTNYQSDDLIGRQVAAVLNFPPRQIAKFMSEVLVLGFPDEKGEVVLIAPDKAVPNGGRLY